jgi:hypothetical protein
MAVKQAFRHLHCGTRLDLELAGAWGHERILFKKLRNYYVAGEPPLRIAEE